MRICKKEIVSFAALTLLLASAPPASAQPQSPLMETTGPWTQGVSIERQIKAEEFFQAGNSLFEEYAYSAASEQYRKALEFWDHPAIHYNLVLALSPLDKPLDIREHLSEAIRHGPEPLDPQKFEHARNSLKLLEGRLARVTITSDEPGASITLDGEPLFVAPGSFEGFIRPGHHTLIGTKAGYLTTSLNPKLDPGEVSNLHVKMIINDIQYRRRWSAWKPWAVVGAGTALAAGGGFLYLRARDNYRTFDRAIERCEGGCVPDAETLRVRTRGSRLHKAAIGTWAAGGAALVTGTVLLLLNQPEAYRPHLENTGGNP